MRRRREEKRREEKRREEKRREKGDLVFGLWSFRQRVTIEEGENLTALEDSKQKKRKTFKKERKTSKMRIMIQFVKKFN